MSLRRNALLLVVATGLLAILGQWSGNGLAGLWRMPAALLLLGLAYERWLASRMAPTFAVQTAARWFLGRPTSVVLQFSATRRDTLLEVALAAPPEFTMVRAVRTLTVSAAGGASVRVGAGVGVGASLILSATARRLGQFRWPPMSARIAGVLGLAWWPVRLATEAQVQVAPDALREPERVPGYRQRGMQAAPRAGAGGEILQLRDYRPGDAPRYIDWKASARRQRLTSRDYVEEQHLSIALAIDIGRASGLAAGDTDRLALYANIAARFAQRALAIDDAVGLLLFAERPLVRLAPARGASALLHLRSALSSMQVHAADGNARLAAASLRGLLDQRSLIVMLTDLDDPGTVSELAAAARLLLPKHLPFIAGVRSEEAVAMARAQAVDASGAFRALAAQEYLGSVERNVRALQALGAAAALAVPSQLEETLIQRYLQFRQRRRVA